MNSFNVMGNIGKDAEVRMTKTGTALTTFSVAFTSGWGENEKTSWVRCTMFGKKGTGEPNGLTPYLLKGQVVAVSGEITLEEWTGTNGNTNKSLVMMNPNFKLGGTKGGNKAPAQTHPAQNQPAPTGAPSGAGNFDDDIPFSNYELKTWA